MQREARPVMSSAPVTLANTATLSASTDPDTPVETADSASSAVPAAPVDPVTTAASVGPATITSYSAHKLNQFPDTQQEHLMPYSQNRTIEHDATLTSNFITPSKFRATTTSRHGRFCANIYPTLLQQNVRWSPLVQMSEVDNANCTNNRCRAGSSARDEDHDRSFEDLCDKNSCESYIPLSNNKPVRFKDNIATFRDKHTMTYEKVNATCGICLGVYSTAPKRRDAEVSTGARSCALGADDGITDGDSPLNMRHHRLTLKSAEIKALELRCDRSRWQRPERDPGFVCYVTAATNTSYTGTDNSPKERRVPRLPRTSSFDKKPGSASRRILYNEGISDFICQQLNKPEELISPPVIREVFQRNNCKPECLAAGCCTDNASPHSQQIKSKYHVSCKKSPTQRYRAAVPAAECRQASVGAGGSRGGGGPAPTTVAYGAVRPQYPSPINTSAHRRKLIPSENDIESFLQAYIYYG